MNAVAVRPVWWVRAMNTVDVSFVFGWLMGSCDGSTWWTKSEFRWFCAACLALKFVGFCVADAKGYRQVERWEET